MTSYSIRIDDDGFTHVDGEAPSLLGLFLEDIDLDDCRAVLRALADVREGKRDIHVCRYDTTRLTIKPAEASFRIAAKLTHNRDVPLTLDELEEGLERLRAALEGPLRSAGKT